MIPVTLHFPGQPDSNISLPPGTYEVGASPASQLQLPFPGVSRHHCNLRVSENSVDVSDSGSSNHTFLNDKLVGASYVRVTEPGILTVGTVKLEFQLPKERTVKTEPDIKSNTPAADKADSFDSLVVKQKNDDPDSVPVLAISGIPEAVRPLVQQIKKKAHQELLVRLNMKRMALDGTSEKDLAKKARDTISEILSELSVKLPNGVSREKIAHELYHEAIGLGPLEDLIARSDITEIMVNGPDQVYVEHKGVLYKTDTAFADDQQVLAAIERIVSPLGRRIDESSPMVDARLKDGSRVNAIIPPLSLVGPSITIRKFSKKPLGVDTLIGYGSLTQDIADFLSVCVRLRKNIVISGGTGSGKTTLLNILSGFLPNRERIITIEDAAELQLRQEHVVRLEARPPNIEGKGEIAIRDLVRNSLRMRPDRIVIGECRGGETLDMLQAMNTGHDGSLTTIHANTPRDALARMETLVLMAGFELPLKAIREQIASAITIIVQINRAKDGSRKVTCVSEITKMEGDIITMQDLFVYHQDGWTTDGKMVGRHLPTGAVPTFMEEIQRANLPIDMRMFTPPKQESGSK